MRPRRIVPRTLLLISSLALTIAALNSSASAQVASYQLDATLCQDVAGVNPNYDTRLPAAAAGAADPMRKRTLTGLDSVCNDGSPAVFYMRPAPAGSPNANKWVIFFDGGGGCASEDDCLERFCSLSGEWIDVAGKMSSLGAPAAIDPPTGLLARVAGNRFGNWNHVLVHYCDSSDYVGSAANKQLDPPSYPGRDYEIEFNGEAIFNEVFAILTSGPTFPDQGPESCYLPDLKNAFVLLGGESAAATGVRSHVDRIAAELAAHNVMVKSVTDASFGPALYDPALVWDPLLSGYASYDELGLNFSTPRWRDFWEVDDSAMDQSCLGSGVADYFCMDSVYLALNEVTTPSFVHADLVDSMGDEKLLDWGLYANRYDIAAATAAQFGTLPLGWGSFGQHCRQHVQIQRRQFNRTTINGGTGWTFHDVLWSWLTGGAVTSDIQGDNGAAPYTTSLLCN